MSSYHPENDPANPDPPGKDRRDEGKAGAGQPDGRQGSAESAGSPNPDPAEGNVTGLEPGGGSASGRDTAG